jgi:hypothetical protein
MIQFQVEKTIATTQVKKFLFHNYRNTALTAWARRGINVMWPWKASGHSSVQMHNRYVDLQESGVANAFGTAYCKKNCKENVETTCQTSASA